MHILASEGIKREGGIAPVPHGQVILQRAQHTVWM